MTVAAPRGPRAPPLSRTMLAPSPATRVHTVFCAECTEDYDYKSLGVFHSHNLSGMPGGVTRLLACDTEELKTYRGLHLGPTFVHQNHKRIWHTRALGPGETAHPFGAARNDSSGSYNKPGSIMHWVREANTLTLTIAITLTLTHSHLPFPLTTEPAPNPTPDPEPGARGARGQGSGVRAVHRCGHAPSQADGPDRDGRAQRRRRLRARRLP